MAPEVTIKHEKKDAIGATDNLVLEWRCLQEGPKNVKHSKENPRRVKLHFLCNRQLEDKNLPFKHNGGSGEAPDVNCFFETPISAATLLLCRCQKGKEGQLWLCCTRHLWVNIIIAAYVHALIVTYVNWRREN